MRDLSSAENGRKDSGKSQSIPPVTLSVIFPAFNEEANIRYTVEAARLVLQTRTDLGNHPGQRWKQGCDDTDVR